MENTSSGKYFYLKVPEPIESTFQPEQDPQPITIRLPKPVVLKDINKR